MKKTAIILLVTLLSSACSNDIDINEVNIDDDSLSIILNLTYRDLVNPYKDSHKIIFKHKSYGIHTFEKLEIVNINGDKVDLVGGYIAVYPEYIDIRLIIESDDIGATRFEYSGNGKADVKVEL